MTPVRRYCKQCGAQRLTYGQGDRCDQCSQWPDDLGWRSAPETGGRTTTRDDSQGDIP